MRKGRIFLVWGELCCLTSKWQRFLLRDRQLTHHRTAHAPQACFSSACLLGCQLIPTLRRGSSLGSFHPFRRRLRHDQSTLFLHVALRHMSTATSLLKKTMEAHILPRIFL